MKGARTDPLQSRLSASWFSQKLKLLHKFIKDSNVKGYENPMWGSRVVTCGRTGCDEANWSLFFFDAPWKGTDTVSSDTVIQIPVKFHALFKTLIKFDNTNLVSLMFDVNNLHQNRFVKHRSTVYYTRPKCCHTTRKVQFLMTRMGYLLNPIATPSNWPHLQVQYWLSTVPSVHSLWSYCVPPKCKFTYSNLVLIHIRSINIVEAKTSELAVIVKNEFLILQQRNVTTFTHKNTPC